MDKEHTQGTSSPKSEATKQRLSEISYQLFKEHGFTWGGHWNSCKDYQHFQKVPEEK